MDEFTGTVAIAAACLTLVLIAVAEVVKLRRTTRRQNRAMRDHIRRVYLAE